jgi:hypothetical protein
MWNEAWGGVCGDPLQSQTNKTPGDLDGYPTSSTTQPRATPAIGGVF